MNNAFRMRTVGGPTGPSVVGGKLGFGKIAATGVSTRPTITNTATHYIRAQGTDLSFQIQGTNNPTTFRAAGLPRGVTVDASTGYVSGAIGASIGMYSITTSAINSSGIGTKVITVMVTRA